MSSKLPPPAPPSCLMRPYSSKPEKKGGTLIAEDVHDLAVHELRLLDPDGYRPLRCPRCGHGILHAHDYRFRIRRDRPRSTSILIRRYVCASEGCRACWQILPGFLARHLQRSWGTIEEVAMSEAEPAQITGHRVASTDSTVPSSTLKRYIGRLSSCASGLRAALVTLSSEVSAVFSRPGPSLTRAGLAVALTAGGFLDPTRRLASLAAWIHRLAPGLRLM